MLFCFESKQFCIGSNSYRDGRWWGDRAYWGGYLMIAKSIELMPKTRATTHHFILGKAGPLPTTVLPTKGDVINYVKFLDQDSNGFSTTRKTPAPSVFNHVAVSVSEMWSQEGIPVHGIKYVKELVLKEYAAYKNANRTKKSQRADADNSHFLKLFDIAMCKCASRAACCCPRDAKVPSEEWPFLKDQRHKRRLTLGSYDRATSEARQARLQRQLSRHRNQQHGGATEPSPGPSGVGSGSTVGAVPAEQLRLGDTDSSDSGGGDAGSDSSADDEEFTAPTALPSAKNADDLRETALAADRYGVSNRAAAAIINAFQVDIGRINENDMSNVVDAKKIWRARNMMRNESARQNIDAAVSGGVESLYFDGRKDKTCTDCSAATDIQEHVVVLSEPGNLYLTHFTPQSGSAIHMVNELYTIAVAFGEHVKALGCDGTAVNIGTSGGVCRLFELATNKPVHWFVCMLHGNELNLRHVFKTLDGTTSGPRTFNGAIGTSCAEDVWRREVAPFQPVPGHVPEMTAELVATLSHDQQLLYRLALAVQTGDMSDSVARQRIGPLNHARWLTLGARVLRLYVSTESPSDSLRLLVQFLVTHYVPVWFCIRRHPDCTDGAKNFHRSVELLRELPEMIQEVVRPVLQRNGYWAHPEQVLLAMVADGDAGVRQEAVRHIQAARQRETEDVRPFRLPELNFSASAYTEVISWSPPESVTQPPLLRHLTDEQLQAIEHSPLQLPNYPVHTQAVERAVRTVTEACLAVRGEEARHGYITARLKHRRCHPVFASKKDFQIC
ncbi:uncharacterized protein LOC122385687 [Amphibalanus amphitrite]|uniref:uncharacterized protein LOC122385687 n=1 Tax=Amphibalanus amphitrite TaxID=1232801 RepID=UPI001C92B3D0|nr:uncharacterized protein LOC122385687 [Amphibalanus amphitrite]